MNSNQFLTGQRIVLLCCWLAVVGVLGGARPLKAAVVGWGCNLSGQATGVPTTHSVTGAVTISGCLLDNVVAVAAGQAHALALKNDGTVIGWGLNNYGQATGVTDTDTAVSAGAVRIGGELLSNITAIAAGQAFSLALRSNGTLVAWGYGECGQTATPFGSNQVVSIAAGTSHAIALKQDGTVVNWGASRLKPPEDLTNVVSIAAGGSWHNESNLALTRDGRVIGWGRPSPRGLSNVTAIATSEFHSLALMSDGTVYGWGDNDFGEATGTPTKTKPRYANGLVTLSGQVLSNVVAIATGNEHGTFGSFCRYSLALKNDGTVVAWGVMNGKPAAVPEGLNNVVSIAAGHNFCLAITTNQAVSARFRP